MGLWDQLIDCICRPPRDDKFTVDDLVGGLSGRFRAMKVEGHRQDLVLLNKRGLQLQCSHFQPKESRAINGRTPCVVYCHCNSGSRRDAEEAICVLIPMGVTVFTMDFMGSGLSDGQWVTLGCTEVEDVEVVVEYLRHSGKVSTMALWGRSMGAVTALLYSQRDPSIAGIVLDSPFSRLTDLILEIVEDQALLIPRPLCKIAVAAMRRSVRNRADFDIYSVAPIDVVSRSFIPALFGHGTEDKFIRIAHSEKLHAAYAGDKNLVRFEGDHNARRPEFFYNSVAIFLYNTLQLDAMVMPGANLNLSGTMTPRAGGGAMSARLSTILSPAGSTGRHVGGMGVAGPGTAEERVRANVVRVVTPGPWAQLQQAQQAPTMYPTTFRGIADDSGGNGRSAQEGAAGPAAAGLTRGAPGSAQVLTATDAALLSRSSASEANGMGRGGAAAESPTPASAPRSRPPTPPPLAQPLAPRLSQTPQVLQMPQLPLHLLLTPPLSPPAPQLSPSTLQPSPVALRLPPLEQQVTPLEGSSSSLSF